MCAKTRVAPLEALTLPHSELQSAVLTAQLLNRIARNLNINIYNVYAFSHSQIVLC